MPLLRWHIAPLSLAPTTATAALATTSFTSHGRRQDVPEPVSPPRLNSLQEPCISPPLKATRDKPHGFLTGAHQDLAISLWERPAEDRHLTRPLSQDGFSSANLKVKFRESETILFGRHALYALLGIRGRAVGQDQVRGPCPTAELDMSPQSMKANGVMKVRVLHQHLRSVGHHRCIFDVGRADQHINAPMLEVVEGSEIAVTSVEVRLPPQAVNSSISAARTASKRLMTPPQLHHTPGSALRPDGRQAEHGCDA